MPPWACNQQNKKCKKFYRTNDLVSLIKKAGSFVEMWTDLESVIQSEIRKKKILYINIHMWNLKIWYR